MWRSDSCKRRLIGCESEPRPPRWLQFQGVVVESKPARGLCLLLLLYRIAGRRWPLHRRHYKTKLSLSVCIHRHPLLIGFDCFLGCSSGRPTISIITGKAASSCRQSRIWPPSQPAAMFSIKLIGNTKKASGLHHTKAHVVFANTKHEPSSDDINLLKFKLTDNRKAMKLEEASPVSLAATTKMTSIFLSLGRENQSGCCSASHTRRCPSRRTSSSSGATKTDEPNGACEWIPLNFCATLPFTLKGPPL